MSQQQPPLEAGTNSCFRASPMLLPAFKPIALKNGSSLLLPGTDREFNLSIKDMKSINIHTKDYIKSNVLSARKFAQYRHQEALFKSSKFNKVHRENLEMLHEEIKDEERERIRSK